MSKKNKKPDRQEMRKKSEADAAQQARIRQERELRNSIGISSIIFITLWVIILLTVWGAGLWGAE